MTLRDEVWNETLKQLIKTGYFQISDLPFDEGQRYTVRRVLRDMEEQGWLERESKRAATWAMGERARAHLNVSSEIISQAKTAK